MSNMSKDRVRFYVGPKYSSYGDKIKKVLQQAFDISYQESCCLMQGNGFWITCRPSQFARFLIYRNEASITNGFMDLRAKLITTQAREGEIDVGERAHQPCYSHSR